MNKYIKPTFILASFAGNSNSPSSCGISPFDREMLFEGLTQEEINLLFGMGEEGCISWVEGFCKFTAAIDTESNPDGSIKQAFFS